MPQALNRYAATSAGQVGVAQAEANSFTGNWLRDNWYRQTANATVACATCILSKKTEQLFRLRYTIGQKSWVSTGYFRQIGQNTYQSLDDAAIHSTDDLLFGTFLAADFEVRWTGLRKIDTAFGKVLAKSSRRIAFNFGVAFILDVGFEGMEYATGTGRWRNPYWTGPQKFRQAGVAIGGDLAIVLALAAWNPEVWVAVPVYFVGSLAWSYIHPIILPNQFEENRNLAPLE